MITTRQSEQNRGVMPATFTSSDWLRRAAEMWAEADAADDLTTKRVKMVLAQGCERIAHHVAAQMEAELMPEANAGRPKPSLPERLLRGLVALLATPFLLLMWWRSAVGCRYRANCRSIGGWCLPRCGQHRSRGPS